MSLCRHVFLERSHARLQQASPSTALPHSMTVIAEKQSRARGWFGIGTDIAVLD
jgi:hypothetical protein